MAEINVVSSKQKIVVDPSSYSVSVVYTGPPGPPGPKGDQGIQGIPGVNAVPRVVGLISQEIDWAQINAASVTLIPGTQITIPTPKSTCYYHFEGRVHFMKNTLSAMKVEIWGNGALFRGAQVETVVDNGLFTYIDVDYWTTTPMTETIFDLRIMCNAGYVKGGNGFTTNPLIFAITEWPI